MKLHRKFAVFAATIVSVCLFSGCSKSASQAPTAQAAAKSQAISGYAPSAAEQAKATALAKAQQAGGNGR